MCFLPPAGNIAAIGIVFLVVPDYVDRTGLNIWAIVGVLLAALGLLDPLRPGFQNTPSWDGLPLTVYLHAGGSGMWMGALLWSDLEAARQPEWAYLVGLIALGAAIGQLQNGELGYLGPTGLASSLLTSSAAYLITGHLALAGGGLFLLAAGIYIADASTKMYRELVTLRAQSENLAKANGWLADHDTLTGLLNRRGLERRLDTGDFGFCLFVDLDHFKVINDTHGHDVGDDVLRTVADRLRNVVSESSLVGRLGGDEFVVVLDKQTEAEDLSRKALDAIRRPILSGDTQVVVSASAGAVPISGPMPLRDLLRLSDDALYDAKSSGRDRVSWLANLDT